MQASKSKSRAVDPPPPGGGEGGAIARFNRVCAVAGLMFLVVTVYGRLAYYEYRGYPPWQDYPQYYMGGLMARLGEWESLYPIPHPEASKNPGFVGNSTLRPRYREVAERVGVNEYAVRFMQPPPTALLMVPLSVLPFRASFYVWVGLLILATVGIGRQAGKMYEICTGRPSRVAGVLLVLICVSPLAQRWISVSNMSALLGWVIGFVTLELVRRDSARGAAAMVAGTVVKYAVLVLAPLVLAMRRWRMIAWCFLFGIGLLVISLLIMGTEPFATFARDIAPTLGRASGTAENEALYAVLLRVQGIERETEMPRGVELIFRAAQGVTILSLLGLILLKRRSFWDEPSHVFAGALALVCWLLIFSPIFWEHYHAYLAPFWGWLAYEATRTRWRGVVAGLAVLLSIAPWALVIRHLGLPRPPELLVVTLLWSAVLMVGLAVNTLVREKA